MIARLEASIEERAEGATIWFRIHKLLDRFQAMLTRRHPDRGPMDYDGEYESEDAEEIVRRRRGPSIRIKGYHEGPKESWQGWILTIVGILIAAGIGGVIYQLSDMKADLRASLTRQELDEKRLDRLETRVYRGTP